MRDFSFEKQSLNRLIDDGQPISRFSISNNYMLSNSMVCGS